METTQVSSSEISTDCSLNSESIKSTEKLCKDLSEAKCTRNEETDFEFVLDLRNLPSIYDSQTRENDSFEILPETTQETENTLIIANSESARDYTHEKSNHVLQERIQILREVMTNLREELKREVALWRQEKEEFQFLRQKLDALVLEEATAAARAAAAAYAAESPLSNELGDTLDITSEATLRELTILEYEKKLAKYQDEFSLTRAEKRYNTRWQLVAHAYKEKLMEVERLCNEELEKVRQNASHLEPLKEIVSQWNFGNETHEDTLKNVHSESLMLKRKFLDETVADNRYSLRKLDVEANVMPEIFTGNFKSEDLTKRDRNSEES